MKIGEKIVNNRQLQNMSQRELARRSDLTPQYLYKIEKDQISPRLDTFLDILHALNENFDSLTAESNPATNLFQSLVDASDKSLPEILGNIGMSEERYNEILANKANLTTSEKANIANFFNIPVTKFSDFNNDYKKFAVLGKTAERLNGDKMDLASEVAEAGKDKHFNLRLSDATSVTEQKEIEQEKDDLRKKVILNKLSSLSSGDLEQAYFYIKYLRKMDAEYTSLMKELREQRVFM